jgi:hypothetical protein
VSLDEEPLDDVPLNNVDERVDAYLDRLPPWQREVCARVRRVVHSADQAVRETIKRTDRPYFVLDGNICALQATRDHVNVFVYDPIAPDPTGLINQGQANVSARSIQVFEGDEPDEDAMRALFRAVIADNRAGGWRALG